MNKNLKEIISDCFIENKGNKLSYNNCCYVNLNNNEERKLCSKSFGEMTGKMCSNDYSHLENCCDDLLTDPFDIEDCKKKSVNFKQNIEDDILPYDSNNYNEQNININDNEQKIYFSNITINIIKDFTYILLNNTIILILNSNSTTNYIINDTRYGIWSVQIDISTNNFNTININQLNNKKLTYYWSNVDKPTISRTYNIIEKDYRDDMLTYNFIDEKSSDINPYTDDKNIYYK